MGRKKTNKTKASILPRSAFFIVQLSLPYMTTEKTIALTTRTFVGKVMALEQQEAMRRDPTSKDRSSGREETSHVQGQERRP